MEETLPWSSVGMAALRRQMLSMFRWAEWETNRTLRFRHEACLRITCRVGMYLGFPLQVSLCLGLAFPMQKGMEWFMKRQQVNGRASLVGQPLLSVCSFREERQHQSPVPVQKSSPSVFGAFLDQGHSDIAANLSHGFKEWVAEGTYAQGIAAPTALHLYKVALDTWHGTPDVAEGDTSEEEAPKQCEWHSQGPWQNPVAPILANGEGGVANFPHPIKAVGALRLSNHIFKVHLAKLEEKLWVRWGSVLIRVSEVVIII